MIRVVLATSNPGKVREVRAILDGAPVTIVDMGEASVGPTPPETGETFLENALIKAVHAAVATGMPAIADDSGLEVSALGGRPGVHSARYAGPRQDHAANIRKLLEEMRDIEDREARFVCTAVLVALASDLPATLPPGVERLDRHPVLPSGMSALVATGEVRGLIAREPRGHGGFGYDPVFFHEGEGATFAEIPASRKDALSHRGIAFRALRAALEACAQGPHP